MTQYPVPDKPGFYWAKYQMDKEYNMIVRVVGTAPFFKVQAWYIIGYVENPIGVIAQDVIPRVVWGPEIPVPEVSNE